ncbi:PAS domain-containing protein [Methanosarcina sp. Mfa9]|uniref:PAS domain-containing protein n=1 Tax=Methanosarcina sp. Mfa9 TaxID=3439063 RepID=UPI003F854853
MMDQFPSNNPNPVLRVDGEGTILYANKAASPLAEYWGTGEGEKLPQAMVNKIKGILSQKNPEKLEINTEKKTYSVTFCPLPEDNCVYLQGFDISPFRHAEEELKKKYEELESRAGKRNPDPAGAKAQLYREISGKKQTDQAPQDCPLFLETLLNTIPAPVLAKDREGKYRECNEFFSREIAGIPKEEILGKTIKEVFPQLSPELADAIHRQDLELLEEGEKDSYETEFPCADGTVRNFLVNRAVFKDENGRTAAMVAVMLDVSELRRNEKKIRNNVKFLETLLNTIPNPVFYKDRKGAYLGCNETFSRMITGLPEEEILGYTLPELTDRFMIDFSPKFSTEEIRKLIENSDQYHREELELIKTGGSQLEEYKAFCADGMKRDFLTSRTAYRNEEGEVAGMVSVLQDITRIKQIERTLRDNLQFLETLINTIPNPIFYKDRNGAYIGCNEVFANRIFGLPREKIIGKTLPALQVPVTEELKEYCHRLALELARTGKKQENDLEFVCADGKTRDFIVNRAAFRDEEGEIAGIVGVMQDITQRKSAQEALRDTVSFLETLLDDIPSPVFQRDKSGIYLNCNETFASQIMGLPKEKVIGRSFADFRKRVPKELVEIYQLHDQELLKQGESQYYETKVVCADGVKRDFLFHKAAYKDSSGNVNGIVGVMLDITQRKEAEEIFRKSEERFREVAERTGQLVYDYDLRTGQSSWEGAIEEITGYGYEEFQDFVPEAWAEHLHPEDRKRVVEVHKKCLETGEAFHEEYRLRRKDGSYFYAEDSGFYLKDENGKVCRAPGVIKDISERKLAQEKIEESEKKFRIIAEQIGQLIFDQDPETGKIKWEGAIQEITGYNSGEFNSFSIPDLLEIIHPEDREKAFAGHEACMKSGGSYNEEFRLRKKNGTYIYVEDTALYLKNEKGNVYRILGVVKDITERKLSMQKIEESEERFRLVAEQTGQGVYDYNVESERLSWTGAIEEISGYRAEDPRISSRELWESHIHPEDRKRAAEYYEQALKEGKEYHQDYRIRRKDGSYAYVENNGVFLKDEKGRVYRMLGAIKDITERRLAREKLEKSEERYRLAAEQTGQIVFEHDLKNEVIDWVGAIQELTGYSPEEFRKFDTEKWEEHVHPEDRKRSIERITEALEKGERFVEEYRFRRKDGDYFYVESCGIGMLDEEGKPFRALGVMKDITGRKLAREKLEKSEERYRLAAENTGQIVYDYEIRTGKIDWTGAIEKLTGYGIEEFRKFGKDEWISHIHPEERIRVVESIKRSLETGDRIQEEFRFRRKDGSYFYVEDSGTVLIDGNGLPYRVIGVKKDITEQKLAREKLERSEERYRMIAEHTGQVLYHDNYMAGKIEWAGAIPEITGYGFKEFQEITENGWLGLVHQEDQARVIAAHEQCRKTGGDFFEEYRLKKADGSYVIVEDEGVYLKDENGTVFKALGVIKDIAEKKLAQKKLKESEERFRVATEQTGQIVFEHDHINDILSWAGAITEITGYGIEEFRKLGSNVWLEHVHPEDRERVLAELRRFKEKDSHFRVEYRFRRKDGSYFHVEDSGVYLRNEAGQIHKAVGVIKDIGPIKLAAEKLQESEERFRIAAEKTGQLVYDFDIGSEEIRWAGAIEDISGYTHEEIHELTTRKLWKEHIHPEDYKEVVKYFANALKTGGSYCQEYRFKRKSGGYIYVEDCGIYLRDKKGRVYRMIGVIKDITERKRGTEELRKSEERFRVVAEQTGQLVYDYDISEDKIRWAGAVKELMEYSEEEFENIKSLEECKEFLHPGDCKRVVDSYKKCLETGERYREEYRLKRKDGNYIYVENRGVFLKDGNGRICRMLGANKDITQLKHSLEKVRESEEKYRSFIQNFKGIAFQGNMDFTALFMHGSLEEITGYREEDFYPDGVRWDQIIDPEDLPAVLEDAEKLRMIPGATTEREYRIRKKDGNICWVHEIVQNISDESGKPILVQGSIYNVTERKEAEEALARTEEIRKKEIHHRIKNNLQVISSLLELQADQFSEEKVVEAFRESQNRVASMAIIHEELYRAGDTETLDFAAYLRKLTSDLLRSYTIRKEDIKLKLEVEEIFLGMDTAIPLGIIINELVSNALKHAFPAGGKGEIHIKLFRREGSGNKSISNITNNIDARSTINKNNQFTLIVSDNGLGFPENIDFTNTDSLGFQLVNTLVEQLEGTIKLERNGTTLFRIKFLESGQ